MRYDEFLRLLENVSGKDEHQKNALCPAHDDTHQSLSVSLGRTGGIVLKCHAGCSTEEVVDALNITMQDLAPPDNTLNGSHQKKRKRWEEYEYTDATGKHAFTIVRQPNKSFKQKHLNPSDPSADRDGYVWKRGDAPSVPYHLPRVLKAIERGETVYIVEGEKDVHTMERHGFTATTNPGGAGKWTSDLSKWFAGASVVLLPDNDTPGIEHAKQVALSLSHRAGHLHVCQLPGLPEKGDVTDFFAAGHTTDDFLKALNPDPDPDEMPGSGSGSDVKVSDNGHITHDYAQSRSRSLKKKSIGIRDQDPDTDLPSSLISTLEEDLLAGQGPAKGKHEVTDTVDPDPDLQRSGSGSPLAEVDVNQFIPRTVRLWEGDEPDAMRWFIAGLIPENFVSILAGHSGLGKSYCALYLACCICLGRSFFGRATMKSPVLWVDMELDAPETKRRAFQIARGMGLARPPEGLHYVRPEKPVGSDETQDLILSMIKQEGIGFCILDSLSVGTSGLDISAGADAVGVMKIVEKWGTVLAIDHITKQGASGNQGNASIYGSTFKRAIARSTIKLTRASGGGVTLQHDKGSFAPPQLPIHYAWDFTSCMDYATGKDERCVTFQQVDLGDSSMIGVEDNLPVVEQTYALLCQLYEDEQQAVHLDLLIRDSERAAKTIRNHLAALGDRVVSHGDYTYSPAKVNYTADPDPDPDPASKGSGSGSGSRAGTPKNTNQNFPF